ncbi:predicted protein [Histoplasma capsulatum G186AR]|uniref:Uncharacterized protein n=1 Tax=Ajellomyces capsulatus (strain G186AR / H82 / ATCC MYA-2454 / RMSCC 2432) TaxID=447093 RepID=C0NXT9_AJECG|nr:uncharacterized protein HCBG_07733 [Histoplasma capsulatum G186AR]EEH03607.1 predicted protein [Histoplasma capsulatum G186AR]
MDGLVNDEVQKQLLRSQVTLCSLGDLCSFLSTGPDKHKRVLGMRCESADKGNACFSSVCTSTCCAKPRVDGLMQQSAWNWLAALAGNSHQWSIICVAVMV